MTEKRILILLSAVLCLLLFSACANNDPAPYTISPEEIVAVKFGSKYPVVTDSRIKEPWFIEEFFRVFSNLNPQSTESAYKGTPSLESIVADRVILLEKAEASSEIYLFLYKDGSFTLIDRAAGVMLTAEAGAIDYDAVVFYESFTYPVYREEIKHGAWIRLTADDRILLTKDEELVFSLSLDDILELKLNYYYNYPLGSNISDPFVIKDFLEEIFYTEFSLSETARDYSKVRGSFPGRIADFRIRSSDPNIPYERFCIYIYRNGDLLIFKDEEGDCFYFVENAGVDFESILPYRIYHAPGPNSGIGFRD